MKYVQFRVAESNLLQVDIHAILVQHAFCRKGPDPVFDDVTAFEAGTELTLLGFNPERTWGKFEKLIGDIAVQCWISLPAVQITGGGECAYPGRSYKAAAHGDGSGLREHARPNGVQRGRRHVHRGSSTVLPVPIAQA